jgi:pimeloyl-ACP methyl ester carboxylesterase
MRADADLRPPALAAVLVELVEALGAPVTLVGNDTGGALCQLAAARLVDDGRTELLSGLVLTNCDTFENFLPRVFRPLQWTGYLPGGVWLVAEAMRARALWSSPLAYGLLQQAPLDAGTVSSYFTPPRRDRGVRRDAAKVLRGIRRRYTLEAAATLRRFDRPTLLAWGTEDRVFRPAQAERLAAAIPEARLVPIEGAAALVPEDQPAALAHVIGDFMAENGPAAVHRPSSA